MEIQKLLLKFKSYCKHNNLYFSSLRIFDDGSGIILDRNDYRKFKFSDINELVVELETNLIKPKDSYSPEELINLVRKAMQDKGHTPEYEVIEFVNKHIDSSYGTM